MSGRVRRAVAGLLAVPVVVAVVAGVAACGDDDGPPETAARVNGQAIPNSRIVTLHDQYVAAQRASEADATDAEEPMGDMDINRAAVTFEVKNALVEQLAKKMGVSAPKPSPEAPVAGTGGTDGTDGSGGADGSGGGLDSSGMSAADLAAAQHLAALSKAMATRLLPKVSVTDAEIQQEYDDKMQDLSSGWQATADVAILDHQADAQRLAAGPAPRDFLAAARGMHAAAADRVRITPDSDLDQNVLSAVASLAPGAVSDAFSVSGHWVVVHLVSRGDLPKPALADIRADLVTAVQDEKRQTFFQTWLSKALKKADIEVDGYFGHWDRQLDMVVD